MKERHGFVSNSSSTSFVVALRKGDSIQDLVDNAGPFMDFAQDLAAFVAGVEPLQSIQNITLAVAQRLEGDYVSPEKILASIKFGEWDHVEKMCRETVENPEEWFFGYGTVDFYDTVIGIYLSKGRGIDTDTLKIRGYN